MKLNKNYICALIYEAFGSLGALCLLIWYSMSAFHERHLHPYAYPFSICSGMISFFICMIAFMRNIISFSEVQKKVKTLLIEFSVTVGSFIVFGITWCFIWDWISKLISEF